MEDRTIGVCVECFNALCRTDEILPDHPTLYECSECGHPNGPITKEENK
jgi:hypothetical protein